MQWTITMTQEELNRSKVIQMAEEKRITQKEGASRLKISERHFRRLLARYRTGGDRALVSGHRGKPSNQRMAESKRKRILEFISDPQYKGFGPTLMTEKLAERAQVTVSKETVRQMMIAAGMHKPKKKKRQRAQPLRPPRPQRGELVQLDGSYHAWLEDRAPKACLLFVDDATSEILAGKFTQQETFFAYGQLCKEYFTQIGLPLAFYSDKFGVFRINASNVVHTDAVTQFGRAMIDLGIDLICANSPQAKGRVERAFGTLQDRLIKEMRLANICDYEQANAFLPTFFFHYNHKFAVLPRSKQDAHRPLDPQLNLDLIFSIQDTRIISKDLQIQFNRVIYQIQTTRPAYALRDREVLAALDPDGQVSFYLNQQLLSVKEFHRQPKQAEIVSSKALEQAPYVPPPDHPWRTYGKKLNGKPVSPSNQ